MLPLPAVDFSFTVEYNVARSKMDTGRIRQRPRFTRPLDTAKATFQLSRPEWATFRGVWDSKLNNGTDWFEMRLPAPNGVSLTLCKVRFISDMELKGRAHELWTVQAAIEFEEIDTLNEDVIDIIIEGGYEELDDFEAAVEAFHQANGELAGWHQP